MAAHCSLSRFNMPPKKVAKLLFSLYNSETCPSNHGMERLTASFSWTVEAATVHPERRNDLDWPSVGWKEELDEHALAPN